MSSVTKTILSALISESFDTKTIEGKNIHWADLLKNARRNSLTPLLYKSLKNVALVPQNVSEQLKQQIINISISQLNQEAIFKEIYQILSNSKLEFRTLKGFYMAREVYQEPFLRPMIDIDILIQPENIAKAFYLLKAADFQSFPVAENNLISQQKHHPFGLKKNGVTVELHKSIFDDSEPDRIDENLFWTNPLEFNVGERKVKTLSKEVFLFHLCYHLMGHLRGDSIKLIWCRDIAEFIKVFGQAIDWSYFLELYTQAGGNEELLHGIYFAHHRMGAEVTESVLSNVTTSAAEIAENYLWFADHTRNDKPRPHLLKKFCHVGGWRNKVGFFLMKLFPVPEFLLLRYKKKSLAALLILYPRHIGNFIYRGFRAFKRKSN